MKTLLFSLIVALFVAGCKEDCVTCARLSISTSSNPSDSTYPRIDSTVTEFCGQEVDHIVDGNSGTTTTTLPDSTVITTAFVVTCTE